MDIQTAAQRLEQAISIARKHWPEDVRRVSVDGGVNWIRLYRRLSRHFGEPWLEREPTPDDLAKLVMKKVH